MDSVKINKRCRTYSKNQFIYFPDEVAGEIFLIEKGRVKVGSYSEGGREIIKSIPEPGEIFGEMALTGEERRRDFARAMDAGVQVSVIGLDEVRKTMEEDKAFREQILQTMGGRLQRMESRLESLAFEDTRTRLLEFLLSLAREKGVVSGEEVVIRNFLTHQDIASLNACSRQFVTSFLSQLKYEGVLHKKGNALFIKDVQRLRMLRDQACME